MWRADVEWLMWSDSSFRSRQLKTACGSKPQRAEEAGDTRERPGGGTRLAQVQSQGAQLLPQYGPPPPPLARP